MVILRTRAPHSSFHHRGPACWQETRHTTLYTNRQSYAQTHTLRSTHPPPTQPTTHHPTTQRTPTHPHTPCTSHAAAGTADAGGGRKNWMLNLLGYYGEESTRLRNAEALFQSCVDQASKKSWLARGRVANEFRPRHALLLTHIWLVHKRLLKDGKPGRIRARERGCGGTGSGIYGLGVCARTHIHAPGSKGWMVWTGYDEQ